jgi:hypothetical protein
VRGPYGRARRGLTGACGHARAAAVIEAHPPGVFRPCTTDRVLGGGHRRGFWHGGQRFELRDWHDAPTPAERAAGVSIVRGEAQARWILGGALRGMPGDETFATDPWSGPRSRLDRTLDDLRVGRRLLVAMIDVRPAVDHLPRFEADIVDLADLAGPEPYEDTWVEFVFEYPDGTKVSGLEYVLVDPMRKEAPGKLAQSGTITRRGVTPGDYTVVLKEVEHVVWEKSRARRDEDLKVIARTSGYPDGTMATVKLYRERTESAGDEVATVEVAVQGDVIEATLRWEPAAGDTSEQEAGVIGLVAEVSLDGGKVWGKTQRALALHLPTLQAVRWSADRADAGATIDIVVEAPGHPADTQVAIELWRLDWLEGDTKVCDIGPVALSGDEATLRCTYTSAAAANAEGTVIEACGEYYVVATIEGDVTHTARSGLLWCAYDVAADDDADAQDADANAAQSDTRAA